VPQSSWLKTCGSPHRTNRRLKFERPLSHIACVAFRLSPTAPRSGPRLFGRIFTVYSCIQVTFPYVFLSPFDLDVCSPFHAFLLCFRHLPSSIAALSLILGVYALNVAHLTTISYNFLHFGPLFIVEHRAACCQQRHLRVRLFTVPPLVHFCVLNTCLILSRVSFAYRYPAPDLVKNKATAAHFALLCLFCVFARPSDDFLDPTAPTLVLLVFHLYVFACRSRSRQSSPSHRQHRPPFASSPPQDSFVFAARLSLLSYRPCLAPFNIIPAFSLVRDRGLVSSRTTFELTS